MGYYNLLCLELAASPAILTSGKLTFCIDNVDCHIFLTTLYFLAGLVCNIMMHGGAFLGCNRGRKFGFTACTTLPMLHHSRQQKMYTIRSNIFIDLMKTDGKQFAIGKDFGELVFATSFNSDKINEHYSNYSRKKPKTIRIT